MLIPKTDLVTQPPQDPRTKEQTSKRQREVEVSQTSASSHSNPVQTEMGSNPSEKRMRTVMPTAANLIKSNKLGMFGSDIPQILHVTEKDYYSLQGPVLQHLTTVVKNLKSFSKFSGEILGRQCSACPFSASTSWIPRLCSRISTFESNLWLH